MWTMVAVFSLTRVPSSDHLYPGLIISWPTRFRRSDLAQVNIYRVSLLQCSQAWGFYPAAVWRDCARHPAAAHQPRPWRLYSDLKRLWKGLMMDANSLSVLGLSECCYVQTQGMCGKTMSMLIFSLSPRDVSTYSSGWTCGEQTDTQGDNLIFEIL